MRNGTAAASVFAIASLFATATFAGSPYYDADGQMTSPSAVVHHRTRAARPQPALKASPVASQPEALSPDQSSVAYGGAAPGEDREVYGRSGGAVPLPRMDPDGFEHREGDKSMYEHAEGSMGAVAADTSTPADTAAVAPAHPAPMPKMDPDGFEHAQGATWFSNHAEGTMGAP